jgi:glutaredoxin-like protein NrdH
MPQVKLYALSTCIRCKHTRELLDSLSADYDCIYVDRLSGPGRSEAINKVKQINPQLSFPTLVIGERVIVGFKKGEIKQALEQER